MTDKQLSVRLPAQVLIAAKLKAVSSGVSMTEVVRRLLVAYVDGKVVVKSAGGAHTAEPEPTQASSPPAEVQVSAGLDSNSLERRFPKQEPESPLDTFIALELGLSPAAPDPKPEKKRK